MEESLKNFQKKEFKQQEVSISSSKFIGKVFLYTAIGLLITAIVAAVIGIIFSSAIQPIDYSTYAMVGTKSTALIQIMPTAGANMVELSNKINKKVEQINKWLPQGLELNTIYDNATYMKESINEVISTIFITILIVILIFINFNRIIYIIQHIWFIFIKFITR